MMCDWVYTDKCFLKCSICDSQPIPPTIVYSYLVFKHSLYGFFNGIPSVYTIHKKLKINTSPFFYYPLYPYLHCFSLLVFRHKLANQSIYFIPNSFARMLYLLAKLQTKLEVCVIFTTTTTVCLSSVCLSIFMFFLSIYICNTRATCVVLCISKPAICYHVF